MTDNRPNPYEAPASEAAELSVHRRELIPEADEEIVELQAYVDRLLSRAVIYSIFWVAGAGSLYSILLATKAHGILREHPGQLYGYSSIVWCYLVGGIGVLLVGSVLTMVLVNA